MDGLSTRCDHRLMWAARLSFALFVFGAAGCGASSAPADSPPPPATSEAVVSIAPPPTTAAGTEAPPAPADSVTAESPPFAASATAGPQLDADEQHVVAMCNGTASMFTDKEQKLLTMAESKGSFDLIEMAQRIRARRKETLDAACARLRAEGKL